MGGRVDTAASQRPAMCGGSFAVSCPFGSFGSKPAPIISGPKERIEKMLPNQVSMNLIMQVVVSSDSNFLFRKLND